MFPQIGGIPSYAVCYNAAIVLHVIVAQGLCRRVGVSRGMAAALSVSYLIAMTAGARVLYDATHGVRFAAWDLFSISYYMRGGLWGGPMIYLALAAAIVWLPSRSRGGALDLVALSLPLPLLVSKVGCFVNGCCYGAATALPWGVTFPANDGGAPIHVAVHPTQLYEVALLACVFVVLIRLSNERWRGMRLAWFLVIYGVGRSAVEFFRGDTPERLPLVGPFTTSQVICLAAAVVAGAVIARRLQRLRTVGHLEQKVDDPPAAA